MVAVVTINDIYWNKNLSDFFFREQAFNTLEDLVKRSTMETKEVLSMLDDLTDGMNMDEIEEDFYSYSVEDIAECFNIELDGEDDEEED